ncbi:hypothetical protein BHU41_09325 [Lactobacillus crispatus]|uniref:Glycosyltransferase 2-like domain-containing protein n=1 Tax=Lactobacillus crispatus TaxID=47770 RepID=A0A2M9WMP1_9LACO|nr:glycosyltransferase [Lactobacillus crispatus]PJZ16663.1 hypothetical protein BHU41_09325 [Lactobacillus crispatus]
MNVVAGIVLYNPNIERLQDNITAVCPQVDKIILYDNGSKNIEEVKNLLRKLKVDYILLTSIYNIGIAQALNNIARVAINKRYNWLLTLDQDSVVFPNLVKNYLLNLDVSNMGQICCRLIDRNIKQNVQFSNDCSIKKVKYCITSGTLVNLKALKKVGGFDKNLFIDWVDNELCCALRKKGFDTYEMNYKGLLQEMGNASIKHFLWKKIYTPNYNYIRYYYNARNSIYVAREYPDEENVFKKVIQQLRVQIHIILFEENKFKKIKAITKGIINGMVMKKNNNRGLYE